MFTRQDIKSIVLSKAHLGSKEAIALHAMNFLRTFAISLPGIFIPIYLFQLPGKPHLVSGDFANSFAWIAVYYILMSITAVLCNVFFLRAVFHSLRFKWSLMLSMAFLVGVLAALVFMKQYFPMFFFAAILSGMQAHFYWVPFHIFFVRKADTGGNFGEESALQVFIVTVAGAIGPLVAGVLINQFGFRVLFAISLFFVLCAAMPVMLWVGEQEHREHALLPVLKSYMGRKRTRMLSLAFAGSAIEGMLYDMAWPLFLFIILKNFIQIGALATFSIAFSSLFILWVGRVIERKKMVWLEKASFVFNALLYGARLLPLNVLRAYAIDIADRANGKLYGISFMTQVYDAAQEFGESDMIIFREFIAHSAQAVAACVVLVGMIVGLPWTFVFVFAMIASFFTLFMFH